MIEIFIDCPYNDIKGSYGGKRNEDGRGGLKIFL
jgi:hypothetical protein